jgi:hypothetical protein
MNKDRLEKIIKPISQAFFPLSGLHYGNQSLEPFAQTVLRGALMNCMAEKKIKESFI